MTTTCDAIVIGGGHNGPAAAAYPAPAGMGVLVLERGHPTGGAAVSDTPFAGRPERVSRYSYLVSLLPSKIARDLGIDVELRPRRVSAYAEGLLVDDPPTSARTLKSFERVTGSDRDHAAWLDFYATTGAVAERLFPTLTEPLRSHDRARELLAGVPGAWEALVEQPLGQTLRERFGHGLVRGVVSTDALIGTFAALDEQSLRQNRCFLYHVIGGRWRVPVGGMGAVTDALARSARRAGAELRTGAEGTAIEHGPRASEGRCDGGAARARHVVAGGGPAPPAAPRGR